MQKNTFSLVEEEDLDKNSGFLMLRVSKLWEDTHERALKKYYDISYTQYAVLASINWLVLHGQNVTQIKLSKHTKISPMSISQILKILEKKDYAYRVACIDDVRAKCVLLTLKGKELVHQAFQVIYTVDEKFFNPFGENRQKFNIYMAKLLSANE